jgi:hypothetical protein
LQGFGLVIIVSLRVLSPSIVKLPQ